MKVLGQTLERILWRITYYSSQLGFFVFLFFLYKTLRWCFMIRWTQLFQSIREKLRNVIYRKWVFIYSIPFSFLYPYNFYIIGAPNVSIVVSIVGCWCSQSWRMFCFSILWFGFASEFKLSQALLCVYIPFKNVCF